MFMTSCSSEYKQLEKYFYANSVLHNELSDSLINFCKRNQTEVILRKSNYGETVISFQILFGSESTFYPVYFDSTFQRYDDNPSKTLSFHIPPQTIHVFNRIAYTSISSDSTQTFFGGASHVKMQLGTQGDVQYGILVAADTNVHKQCVERLAANVCLTERTIP